MLGIGPCMHLRCHRPCHVVRPAPTVAGRPQGWNGVRDACCLPPAGAAPTAVKQTDRHVTSRPAAWLLWQGILTCCRRGAAPAPGAVPFVLHGSGAAAAGQVTWPELCCSQSWLPAGAAGRGAINRSVGLATAPRRRDDAPIVAATSPHDCWARDASGHCLCSLQGWCCSPR